MYCFEAYCRIVKKHPTISDWASNIHHRIQKIIPNYSIWFVETCTE